MLNDYSYRKGDPCPYGRTKIGKPNITNGDDSGWSHRQNPENRGYDPRSGEVPSDDLRQRGYRPALVRGRRY